MAEYKSSSSSASPPSNTSEMAGSGGSHKPCEGKSIDPAVSKEISEFYAGLSDRYSDFLRANAYDGASGIRKEVDGILDRYRTLYRSEADTALKFEPTSNGLTQFSGFATGTSQSTLKVGPEPNKLQMSNWFVLAVYAWDKGATVTGANEKTDHNRNSPHYRGDAIDIRTRGVDVRETNRLIVNYFSHGLSVRDERTRPKNQEVWKGPHIHVEVPLPSKQQRLLLSPLFYSEANSTRPNPSPLPTRLKVQ
jgi:hypothetical protein